MDFFFLVLSTQLLVFLMDGYLDLLFGVGGVKVRKRQLCLYGCSFVFCAHVS